jgi:hypothetical protein
MNKKTTVLHFLLILQTLSFSLLSAQDSAAVEVDSNLIVEAPEDSIEAATIEKPQSRLESIAGCLRYTKTQ